MKIKENIEIKGILKNTTIKYDDNIEEKFEAVKMTNKGIIIGRIIEDEFIEIGYIPKDNVKEITIE
jgi:hypothetical protein